MNRIITALAVALALAGCGSADPINREQGDPRQAAKGMELNWLVARMTDQLMERKSLTTLSEPIAVASFVDLDTLKDTNWMGLQIEESFIYELNRRGEVVVDFKTTGNIQVTPQGDFVMSRNYKDLSSRLPISRIASFASPLVRLVQDVGTTLKLWPRVTALSGISIPAIATMFSRRLTPSAPPIGPGSTRTVCSPSTSCPLPAAAKRRCCRRRFPPCCRSIVRRCLSAICRPRATPSASATLAPR